MGFERNRTRSANLVATTVSYSLSAITPKEGRRQQAQSINDETPKAMAR
jgi:hypothetical protein